jgi:hypothetical protein
MRVLDANNRQWVELTKPILDLNDMRNKNKVTQTEITTQKIDDALARFAESLESLEDTDEMVTYEEKDAYEKGGVVVKVAGIDSEDDSEGDGEGDNEEDKEASLFTDMRDIEFHNEVNEVLYHMAASRMKPPPSLNKQRSSVKKTLSRKFI